MAMKVQEINISVINETAQVVCNDPDTNTWVNATVKVPGAAHASGQALNQHARAEAKKALQAAIAVL